MYNSLYIFVYAAAAFIVLGAHTFRTRTLVSWFHHRSETATFDT